MMLWVAVFGKKHSVLLRVFSLIFICFFCLFKSFDSSAKTFAVVLDDSGSMYDGKKGNNIQA